MNLRAEDTTGRFVCIGAGGHGRSVVDLFTAGDSSRCAGFLDPDPALKGKSICGYPVLGGDELLPQLRHERICFFVITFGSTGAREECRRRAEKFQTLKAMGLIPLSLRHVSASISQHARIGEGTVVLPGAIVNAGAQVGDNVILNSGSIVEHDCIIDDHVHVATGAVLCGGVRLAERVHVGAGAVILQNVSVGAGSVIGAGSIVIRDVEPDTVVAGAPAQAMR